MKLRLGPSCCLSVLHFRDRGKEGINHGTAYSDSRDPA